MEESSESVVVPESDKRRGKKKHKRRRRKVFKTLGGGGRRALRKFALLRKRNLSKKRSTKGIGKKQKQDALHLQRTIDTWKLRWKNPQWRQKWKLLWGKNRWKTNIRKRWNMDKKWRRKWMKKILKKWWDKKWRWKWQKRWIDRRWLSKWKKRRMKRRRLWKKRWVKSGARKMGLSFNEFLLTERRLKGLQKNNHVTANRKRRERRFLRDRLIRDQLEKREKMKEELGKVGTWKDKMRYLLFNWDYFGPETFGIRPAVIQFKFYMMIAIQGLAAFVVLLYYHLADGYVVLEEYIIHGLLGLVYFASAMDFFGGIFGMMTSYHLESYYGRGPNRRERRRRSDKKSKCFGCCSQEKKGKEKKRSDQVEDVAGERGVGSLSVSQPGTGPSFLEIPGQSSNNRKRSRNRSRDQRSFNRNSEDNQDERKVSGMKRPTLRKVSSRVGGRRKAVCKCWGLEYLYCSFLRTCFRAGKSRDFVNRMGYISWILLELAWFLNIFFTAYYSWLEIFHKDFETLQNRCLVVGPVPKYCGEFEETYYFLLMIVGITFVLRNLFIFVIGMCFSERYLKRCEPSDPYDEMQSTCSDTDMDYSKVPRQILVPHIFSNGRYPYVLPGATRPVDYMLRRIRKVMEKHHKKKLESKQQKTNKKRPKNRRRLLSTFERDAQKATAEFRQIRRVQVPLEKGKRKPWRLPVAAAVPDVQQLPADLLTTKAWAWLHDDSSSTEDEEKHNTEQDVLRQRRLVRWRRSRRKKKAQPIDSAELTLLHEPGSKSQLPLEVMVLSKLQDLSDRDSTDSSWSGGPASLYDDVSGHSEVEAVDRRDYEAVMELMTREDEIVTAEITSANAGYNENEGSSRASSSKQKLD